MGERLNLEENILVSDKAKEIIEIVKSKNNYVNDLELRYYFGAEEIAKELMSDEKVIYAVNNSGFIPMENAVIAISNRRVLYGGYLLGSYTGGSFNLEDIISIKVSGYFLSFSGYVEINFKNLRGHYQIGNFSKKEAERIQINIMNAIQEAKRINRISQETTIPQATPVQQESAADEIKKFKELLDMGAISQEEFDAKKKQLLGL